jgi:hypothetical protein
LEEIAWDYDGGRERLQGFFQRREALGIYFDRNQTAGAGRQPF